MLTRLFVLSCRAQQLIAGLGGEKTRWNAAATRLAKEYEQLTGDVLLASAQIAYLGPFTAAYRWVPLRAQGGAGAHQGIQ
jgi:dynein heavy chain